MRILKFGGTSVATAARRAVVAGIVRRALRRGPVTVVTSALAGVTDLLQEALSRAVAGKLPARLIAQLRGHHLRDAGGSPPAVEARRQVTRVLAELEQLLTGVALLGECPPAARHRCLAAGERLALPLVVAALETAGMPAASVDGAELLVAHRRDPQGEPELDLDASRRRVRAWRQRRRDGNVAVVTGFVAGDGRGGTLTLGRGASDLTATLLASLLDAEAAEIWSDVDGLLSGPPDLVPEVRPLPRLSYGEAAGLALFGAEVLHPETLAPAAAAGIPVWIKNTLSPESPGTRIGSASDGLFHKDPGGIRAVTMVAAACRLRIRAPWHRHDLMSRAFAALEGAGVRPHLVDCGGPGRLDVVVAAAAAARIEEALRRQLATAGLSYECRDVALVMAIGGGPRTASAVLGVLREQGVEPLAVTAPGAEASAAVAVLVVVDEIDGRRAVTALHQALISDRSLLPPPTPTQLPMPRTEIAGIA